MSGPLISNDREFLMVVVEVNGNMHKHANYNTTHATLNLKAGATQRSMSDFLHKAQ